MSFGAAHFAAIHFMTHAVPEDRAATAQGLYAAVVAGLVLGGAIIASGGGMRLSSHAALARRAGGGSRRPSAPELGLWRNDLASSVSEPRHAVARQQQWAV